MRYTNGNYKYYYTKGYMKAVRQIKSSAVESALSKIQYDIIGKYKEIVSNLLDTDRNRVLDYVDRTLMSELLSCVNIAMSVYTYTQNPQILPEPKLRYVDENGKERSHPEWEAHLNWEILADNKQAAIFKKRLLGWAQSVNKTISDMLNNNQWDQERDYESFADYVINYLFTTNKSRVDGYSPLGTVLYMREEYTKYRQRMDAAAI